MTSHQTPDKLLHVYSNISHSSGKCEATRTGGETAKSTHTVVSRDEGNPKEDTGKSIKNVLYVLQCVKRHISGRSNVEQ